MIRSQTIGLRLWGIADEPFWVPARNGSSASRTSVRCRWRISVAKRSSPAPASATASQQLRVAVARHHLRRHVLAAQPEPGQHRALHLGPVRRVGAHGARQRAHRHPLHRALEPAQIALGLEREARELHPEGGGLGLDPVRAAHAERAGVLARAPDERVAVVARAAGQDQAGLGELERERGVQHVGGGEPVVDPAPGGAHRLGHHVDEGGHVVVGQLLALADRLGREGGAVADGVGVVLGHHALRGQHVDHRQLHVEPAVELALLGPHRAHLGAGVALDHVLRMRAASTAAFLALSTPTEPTGTPGGIWVTDSSASSPPATDVRELSGTPITGRSV